MSFDLDALLAQAEKQFDDREPEFVPVVLAGEQVGVRFLPLRSGEWNDLTEKHPPRPDVPQDVRIGYNVPAVVAAYPDVVLVAGDQVDDMVRHDEDGEPFSKWPVVYGALTAKSRKSVAVAMWAAHERTPELLVVEAGKASSGSRRKKRS